MQDFEALTAVLLKFISSGMLSRVNWQTVTDLSTNSAFDQMTRCHIPANVHLFRRITLHIKWDLNEIILLEVDSYFEENIPLLHCKYQRCYGNSRYL